MTHLLDSIQTPSDLRVLTKHQLHILAEEIRQEVIHTVAENGGHLGPNLGVVELSLALHYVFNSPKDKMIWDVGHQSYPHKLLTGRKARFKTLRKKGGITGYPNIKESDHDAFGTSHSSTSISAGLGMAVARDLNNEDYKVIPIIGDGALTGGMSFEALNQLGHLQTDMIVVLNDNDMSISENVGALSSYLSNIVTNPKYADLRNRVKESIVSLPGIGEKAAETVGNFEDTLRSISSIGMYFKALGLKYFGPIDGHDLEGLIKAFRNLQKIKGPVILHVVTKKGKGYDLAEEQKEKYHGVSPFNVSDGSNRKKSAVTSYTAAFSKAMITLAEKDDRIIGITAAMPKGTGLDAFGEHYPDRYFDVGIAEQHAITFAAGLARMGKKPVAAIYSTFLQRAYDQIIHDVCVQNLDVTFAIDRAGIVGEDGACQHGAFDYSYLSAIPHMIVCAPKDENELGHLLKSCIEHNGPAAIRYPRGSGIGVSLDGSYKSIPIGKSELIKKGKDITLIGVGFGSEIAKQASDLLKEKGISAEVINARFVKPLDSEAILKSAKKTNRVITIEENVINGGFGSLVTSLLNKEGIFVHCIGMPDRFVAHGTPKELREEVGLSAEQVCQAALDLI